jgi:hypothetical protein
MSTAVNPSVNPYQSPSAEIVPEKPLLAQGVLTETMLNHLKEASPWLRFVGILGFVASGLTVFSGISFLSAVALFGQVFEEIAEFGAAFSFLFSGTMAVYFLGLGVFIFFLSLFAYRFGTKIRSYLGSGVEQDLEIAFRSNRNYWKLIGILYIVCLAFFPLLIIGSFIFVAYSALLQ